MAQKISLILDWRSKVGHEARKGTNKKSWQKQWNLVSVDLLAWLNSNVYFPQCVMCVDMLNRQYYIMVKILYKIYHTRMKNSHSKYLWYWSQEIISGLFLCLFVFWHLRILEWLNYFIRGNSVGKVKLSLQFCQYILNWRWCLESAWFQKAKKA